jgi:hypothetical protein
MRRTIVALLVIGALGCAAILAGRPTHADGPEDAMADTAPTVSNAPVAAVASNAPPIDREVPVKLETATFALG